MQEIVEETDMTRDNATAETPEETHPQQSSRTRVPMAAGAALRGLPHVSRMDRVMHDIRETTEHVKQSKQKDDAHLAHNDGHWIPVAPDEDEEVCPLGMDDDPWTY